MRLPEKGEDLTGKVCVCSVGRVAVVCGRKDFEFGSAWAGIGFDGKGNWASTSPCVVAESVAEFHNKLQSRFGGKMAYND